MLDIGCLGRAGDKTRKPMLADLDASIRFVHVVDDLRSRDDQRNVLRDKVENSMMNRVVGHPDGPVFRHTEVTTENGVVNILQLMRIVDRFLGGEITAAQLQEWAENLEVREDVAFADDERDLLDDVFFRIATPMINGPLTRESVSRMKNDLRRKTG